jgi:glycerophosphoryl diester phosphodiesterase
VKSSIKNVRKAARGQQVNVRTVNEESDMRRMVGFGVDVIMTNYSRRLKQILDESA